MLTFGRQEESVWNHGYPESIQTDSEGRFRIRAVLPGYRYRLRDPNNSRAERAEFSFGNGLRWGETKDLGDVRLERKAASDS